MTRLFYTVSFFHRDLGAETTSRFFTTLHAARNWAKWLESQSFVETAKIWRGEAGGELIS